MKRRAFIKSTLPLAFSPLLIESVVARNVGRMLGLNPTLTGFEDRKLIILNLFGGNDGLNCAVPLDQYSLYESHRSTIKIAFNELIKLDNTLPDDQLIGLHPSLSEFKTLYDEEKLNLIQSVGYPTPNFSHFRSDSLIFGAKDGSYGTDITQGWMANYLETVFPSYSDRPTTQLPDPLGIQIGLTYRHNGYLHKEYNNLGININNLANSSFYPNLLPSGSDYGLLLQYLKQVEEDSMQYKQNLEESFDAGTNMNGATAYPDSDLGNQFKTLARLISGGIESKILLAFRGGWDTHHTQVDITNTSLGKHANLLNDVSQAVYAFQRDMEGQSMDDKVILLIVSEFGRQVVQNDNDGTDHGSLAPWFILGTPIKGGVTGRNIDLSLLSGNHTADVLQHDYRRILSTIIQDWFGNTDSVLDQMGLGDFSGEEGTTDGKLDIIDDAEVVTGSILLDDFSELFVDEFDLVEIKTDNGWTYYGRTATSTVYLFAIEHKPDGGNLADFTPLISISDMLDDGTGKDYFELSADSKANYVFGKIWNIVLSSGSVDGFVNMRFFANSSRVAKLNQYATGFQNDHSGSELSTALWIKTVDAQLDPDTDLNEGGFTKGIESLTPVTQGVYEYQNYYQFDDVTNFSGRGGTICHIVTNEITGFPQDAEPGTIIFSESGKLWGFNGNHWVKLAL